MRRPRLKPDGVPMFFHLYNRVAGEPDHYPFGPAEKEKFITLLHKLQTFFVVEILAYQVMSNHFHLLVYAPADPPSTDEAARRYNVYYGGKRTIMPDDPYCPELARRMRDISWFMHGLQHQFAMWYNRSRVIARRGSLWADRFKHTLLGSDEALWACWKYIEMNPARAGIVSDPADYRFSSYGAWSGKGAYPFNRNLQKRLLPALKGIHPFESTKQLLESFRSAINSSTRGKPTSPNELMEGVVAADRRTRFWIDGLVIGSSVFLRDMIARSNGILKDAHDPPLISSRPEVIPTAFCVYNGASLRF